MNAPRKTKRRAKVKVIINYCKECDCKIYGHEKICGPCKADLDKKEERERIGDKYGRISCTYIGCRSELAVILEGRYCSQFCLTEQKRIIKKKNEEIAKRAKQVLKDVEKIPFESELLAKETTISNQARVNKMRNDEIATRTAQALRDIEKISFELVLLDKETTPDRQEHINKMKNEEIAKRTEQILKDVEKMSFDKEIALERQEIISKMKNEEIIRRTDCAIKEVSAMIFNPPIYTAPIEQASNLFGVNNAPRVKNNTNETK